MTCETFRGQALDFLDGTLEDRSGFLAHRETCPECAALLEGIEANERILRGAALPVAAPDAWPRIAAALAVRPRRRPWLPWAAAAAAALLAVVPFAFPRHAPPRPTLDVTIVDAGPEAARALGVFVPRYEDVRFDD